MRLKLHRRTISASWLCICLSVCLSVCSKPVQIGSSSWSDWGSLIVINNRFRQPVSKSLHSGVLNVIICSEACVFLGTLNPCPCLRWSRCQQPTDANEISPLVTETQTRSPSLPHDHKPSHVRAKKHEHITPPSGNWICFLLIIIERFPVKQFTEFAKSCNLIVWFMVSI